MKKITKFISIFVFAVAMSFLNFGVAFREQRGGGDFQCTSGGLGSSQCSGSWEVLGVAVNCSVTCNSGYYACCYLDTDPEGQVYVKKIVQQFSFLFDSPILNTETPFYHYFCQQFIK